MNTKTATVQPLDHSAQFSQALLPAVTVDKSLVPVVKKDITDAYTHFDIALRSVDTALSAEAEKLGKNWSRQSSTDAKLGWGLAILTAGATAAVGFTLGGGFGAATFFGLGIPSIIGGITASNVLRSKSERTPISQAAVQQLRLVSEGVPQNSAEAVAIAEKAAAWSADLKKREVHGPGAHDALQKLSVVSATADAESQAQSARWLALRDAAQSLRDGTLQYHYDRNTFLHAFAELPEDERRAIAPIMLDAIFKGERPRGEIGFDLASSVYALLRQTIDGAPVVALLKLAEERAAIEKEERAAKKSARGGKKDVDEEPIEASGAKQAPSVSTTTLPAVSFECNVADLQPLLANFETLLTDVLADRQRFMRGTGAVDAAKIERVLATANDPARTTVERAFLAKRLERFGSELHDAQLYGYDARVAIDQFVTGATAVPVEILTSAKTLEAYFAATAPGSKAALTEAQVSAILDSLSALAPAQQKSAAQRAQSRYFDGEKARGKTEFAAATRLGTGLLKYL